MRKIHRLLPEEPYLSYAQYRRAVGQDAAALARNLGLQAVLEELEASGLRGRGGAGFPAGTKWRSLARPFVTRHVVCNLAEGEPGTFKDRYLALRNPYAILEGMLVAATVLQSAPLLRIATKGKFRAVVERLGAAAEEMEQAGDTGRFRFEIVEGPDAYLFGEEKALLNVIEGNGPFPREAHYPPYERGLDDTSSQPAPALVQNAETWARVPDILRHGAASFRRVGTEDTPGTLLVTLSGAVRRHGVFEVEAGTTLAEVLEEHGGGPLPGRRFVAALSGVANPVLPADRFDTPLEFTAMYAAGGGLGSAGFILLDDATPGPRVAEAVSRFLYVESCGQCGACKSGLGQASDSLGEYLEQDGPDPSHLLDAVAGAERSPQSNRCYLPVQGAKLIPSLIARFWDDFPEVRAEERWELPLLASLDEEAGRFTIDRSWLEKDPDWGRIDPDHAGHMPMAV